MFICGFQEKNRWILIMLLFITQFVIIVDMLGDKVDYLHSRHNRGVLNTLDWLFVILPSVSLIVLVHGVFAAMSCNKTYVFFENPM